jgi:hypothetical protein
MLKLITVIASLIFALPTLAAPGDPPAPANAGTSRPTPRSTSGVMRYDTNGDGFVDRAEWNAGQEARFKQLDTDGDGRLSRDELFARTPSTGPSVLPSDAQLRRQDTYFRLLDADRDGFVSKEEFMAQAARNFARCDLDKDGRINTDECRQALRRRPADPASANR